MHSELQRTKKEKTELQRTRVETLQPAALPHGRHNDEGKCGLCGPGIEILDWPRGEGKTILTLCLDAGQTYVSNSPVPALQPQNSWHYYTALRSARMGKSES